MMKKNNWIDALVDPVAPESVLTRKGLSSLDAVRWSIRFSTNLERSIAFKEYRHIAARSTIGKTDIRARATQA